MRYRRYLRRLESSLAELFEPNFKGFGLQNWTGNMVVAQRHQRTGMTELQEFSLHGHDFVSILALGS